MDESLENGNYFTLVMDGWSNIRRRSIYGMLLCNPHVHPIVSEICDTSSRASTGGELLSLVRNSLKKWMTKYHGIDAVVTDNASNMRLMKEYLASASSDNEETPSIEPQSTSEILIVPCFAHVLNLLLKSILCHSRCRSVLKDANEVVSHFRNNSYWSWKMEQLERQYKVSHSLQTYSETRWYSAVNMLRTLADHEPIFRHIADPEVEDKLPERVEETIINRRFFDNIQTVLSVCAPIAESIGRLEQRNSTLADCFIELLRIVYRLQRKQKPLLTARMHAKYYRY